MRAKKKNYYFNELMIKIIYTCLSLSLIHFHLISEHLSQAHSPTPVSHFGLSLSHSGLSLSLLTLSTPISQATDQPQTYATDRSACSWILGTWLGNPWNLATHPFYLPSSPMWSECLLVVGFFFFSLLWTASGGGDGGGGCGCGWGKRLEIWIFFFFLLWTAGGGGGGCGCGWW